MDHIDLFELQIDPASRNHLAEGAKWGKFLAIIGFISCGLIVGVAFSFGYILSYIPNANAEGLGYAKSMFTVVYLALAAVQFFPCLFLYNYASKIKAALLASDQEILGGAFSQLKSLFKYIGIITIIFLAFFLLMVIMMILALANVNGIH